MLSIFTAALFQIATLTGTPQTNIAADLGTAPIAAIGSGGWGGDVAAIGSGGWGGDIAAIGSGGWGGDIAAV